MVCNGNPVTAFKNRRDPGISPGISKKGIALQNDNTLIFFTYYSFIHKRLQKRQFKR